jgi:hypothetical protein
MIDVDRLFVVVVGLCSQITFEIPRESIRFHWQFLP